MIRSRWTILVAPEYHGNKGVKALKKALEYLVNNGGKPELKPDGTPYEIFNKIQWVMEREGSKSLIAAAKENPDAVLADRDARLAHLLEVKATVDKVTNRSEIGNKPTPLPERILAKEPAEEAGYDADFRGDIPYLLNVWNKKAGTGEGYKALQEFIGRVGEEISF